MCQYLAGYDAVVAVSFGALVRAWRERALLSQAQLAARAGLGVRTVRRLESTDAHRPHGDSLYLLANALELSTSERAQLLHAARAAESKGRTARSKAEAVFAAVVPRQLPAPARHFVGRAEALKLLAELLEEGDRPDRTVMVTVIGGVAGIGKTTLAVHWAHLVADRFPDGQLYADLRGFSPGGRPVDPATAVRAFLDALTVPSARIPADLDSQAGLYRSLLAGRRMLIVLDNAQDSAQVGPLLPGSPGCSVVVTSRNRLSGLGVAGANYVNLDRLSTLDARELLAGRLERERVGRDPHAIEQIIACCAGLPLALAIVAARAAGGPHTTLAALAAELADARSRLDALSGDEPAGDVRAVFSWSYHHLSAGAARMFRLLGLHPGPEVSVAAAASLSGLAPRESLSLLRELERAHLMVEQVASRYAFHDLMCAYAAECAHREEDRQQIANALERTLDHYVHTGYVAALELTPARDKIMIKPASPGTLPEHISGHAQARAWFTTERPVLIAAVARAAEAGLHTHVWQIAWTVSDFLDRTGFWEDRLTLGHAALAAGMGRVPPGLLAKAYHNLAHTYLGIGRLDDAYAHLDSALRLLTDAHDDAAAAHTHRYLADLRLRQHRWAEALEHAQRSNALGEAAGHKRVQADALNSVARALIQAGRHREAIAPGRRAMEISRDIGYTEGQAEAWVTLGDIHRHLPDRAEAITCYRKALTLHRQVSNRYYLAGTLTRLGDVLDDSGHRPAARGCWRRALTILEEFDHPDSAEVRARLIGSRARPRR